MHIVQREFGIFQFETREYLICVEQHQTDGKSFLQYLFMCVDGLVYLPSIYAFSIWLIGEINKNDEHNEEERILSMHIN